MDPQITLTKIEMLVACLVGSYRRTESRFSGREDNKHTNGDFWMTDMEGAAAEMAYCKFRNNYWGCTVNSFHDADVGKNVQIRTTKYPDGKLIIRPDARPDDFYILLTGVSPVFTLRGWIKASDAMVKEFLKNPNGTGEAYFIPQDHLTKFKTPLNANK